MGVEKINSFDKYKRPEGLSNEKYRGKIEEIIRSKSWGIKEGDLVTGNLVITKSKECFIISGEFDEETLSFDEVFLVDKDSVARYTGFVDNDDKEVYEGDLFEHKDTLRRIIYREDKGAWMAEVVEGHIGSCSFYLRDRIDNSGKKLEIEII